ncbi:hypothetical protein PO124_29160 [Bacillus licheniformis]|nr:hypothetical protein [Bacillus licheniformis]
MKGPIKIEPGGPDEIITFSDDAGAFGTITETSVFIMQERTQRCLAARLFRPSLSKEEASRLLDSLTKCLNKFTAAGTFQPSFRKTCS